MISISYPAAFQLKACILNHNKTVDPEQMASSEASCSGSTVFSKKDNIVQASIWLSFMLFLSCLLCFYARLFADALWSPAGKGLTSWLSFMMSNCDVVTFPLLSWVRCGA